jgi:pilus assembly protein CpaF
MTVSSEWSKPAAVDAAFLDEVVRTELYRRLPPQQLWESMQIDRHGVERDIIHLTNDILNGWGTYLSQRDRRDLEQRILDEILGFGPLQPLIDDPRIQEIMVNGPDEVWVERDGILEQTAVRFTDEEHVLEILHRIVDPLGRRIDLSSPMVNARLPGGSRVNAIIKPLALNGPTITIRKFRDRRFSMAELIQMGAISADAAEYLGACVRARLNVLVSGGTGSGKTTLLNILSSYIPGTERIITIEDAAELQLTQPHVVRLEARPANVEGSGAVPIRDLVINALRMRPDRIIVGEVRGGETVDMLQAMNTGHEGSMTTVHANSARLVVSRIETMVLWAGFDMPLSAIRRQLADAIHVIVHQDRMPDGTRRVVSISEMVGVKESDVVMQDIFVRAPSDGTDRPVELLPTGSRSRFATRLAASSSNIPANLL